MGDTRAEFGGVCHGGERCRNRTRLLGTHENGCQACSLCLSGRNVGKNLLKEISSVIALLFISREVE